MLENTQDPARLQQPARLPWPAPGPDSNLVTWPQFLALAAEECERLHPGSPGRFLAACLHALSAHAVAMRAESPESHEAAAEAERLHEAAWIHSLEQQQGVAGSHGACEHPGCSDCDLGGWGGHDDSGPMRAWLGDPACDDTYAN
jgi:hypothetical protein